MVDDRDKTFGRVFSGVNHAGLVWACGLEAIVQVIDSVKPSLIDYLFKCHNRIRVAITDSKLKFI